MAPADTTTWLKIGSAAVSAVLVIVLGIMLMTQNGDPDEPSAEPGPGTADATATPMPGDGGGTSTAEPTTVRAPSSDCGEITDVEIVTTEEFVPVLAMAADRAVQGGTCAAYDIGVEDPSTVALTLGEEEPVSADVWVPDSPVWVERANAGREAPVESQGVLAMSPVVLAVPGPVAAAADLGEAPSWAGMLGGDIPVRMSDPMTSTASLIALMSASAALGETPAGQEALGGAMISLSRQVAPEDELFAASTGQEAAVFPTSEQQAWSHNSANTESPVVGVVPAEGMGVLEYHWVPLESAESAGDAVTELRQALTDEEGEQALAAEGFRAPDGSGAPGVPGVPEALPEAPATPPVAAVEERLRAWRAVSVDMRMLAVIDVSGSMREPAGNSTRIALAAQSAQAGLLMFPPSSQVGLWEFSTDLDGEGKDWRERAPIARLDATAEGGTHRDLLLAEAASLPGRVGGDTGLYDTILAAYLEVQRNYDPEYINSVVLLTDGINDDDESLTLQELLFMLEQASDPARPVRIIAVGMGPEADAQALESIAQQSNGSSYIAENPIDIRTVFIDALLQRRTAIE